MTVTIATLRTLRAKPAKERGRISIVLVGLACATQSLADFHRLVMTIHPERLPVFDDAVMRFIMTEMARDPADGRWTEAAAFAEREFAAAHSISLIDAEQRDEESKSEYAAAARAYTNRLVGNANGGQA
jgi:hypothetical protein